MSPKADKHPTASGYQLPITGKHLTFNLRGQSYGVDVLKVCDVVREPAIMTIPDMPQSMGGIVNLRGRIVPVVDLGLRLGFPPRPTDSQSCMVVVQGKLTQIGILVDGVEDVVNVTPADVEYASGDGRRTAPNYVLGVAQIKGSSKTLLDVDRVLSTQIPAAQLI